MGDAVVSFGLNKLWDLLSRESERLHGIDEQVDGLKRQLRMLQSFLKDADAKKHEREMVRNFLEDVKDIVYDAEDIIESYILKESGGNKKGIKKQARRLACFLIDRHNVASDIKGITKKISQVIGGMQSLGIREILDDGGCSLSFQDKQREIRQTFPNSSESDLVGVEQRVEELAGRLVEDDKVQVVSISGMGGIGKTTLARQVFHHDSVRRRFDGFAWVCVSQQFTQKRVWQRILQQLRPKDGEVLHMDEYALQGKLYQLLETASFLVVLDDVWKEEDWDRIKAAFPKKKKGWKMILTSRNEGVGLHVDPTCLAFKARILNPEESWKLCERIVFPTRKDETEIRLDDEEMEAMGKEMVTYCGGLPLAVKVLGGLLANKHTVGEWKRVSDHIGVQMAGTSVNQILSLSYEDLPMHLKHCFLYLAHSTEDCLIDTQLLFNYWAAEGIYDGSSTIQGSGEGYLEELVRRNMVVVGESYLRPRIESFQMHDMMREVCLSKAKEENFLQIIKASATSTSTSTMNAQSPSRARRLFVHSGSALHLLGHKNNRKARSFVFWGLQEDWKQSALGFQSLPFLRVLDLSGVKFEGGKLPCSIGGLIHLRFLNLCEAKVSHLPSTMRKFKRLLYLDLNVALVEPIHVPNVLKELLELRYLALPRLMHDKTKLELGELVNLEYLWNFSTQHCSVRNLHRMSKLRILAVSLKEMSTLETLSSSLFELRNLETLKFLGSDDTPTISGYVGEFFLEFIHLKELTLAVPMSKISDQHRFPPHIEHLQLYACHMEEDPMPILEKLSHLKSVELVQAFVGRKMVCSKGGFLQLRALDIFELPELEEWIVEEGSMPCLCTLTIHDCKKLKALPHGLKYITSLEEVWIEGMNREWMDKLIPGGEDYYKVEHVPNVQLIGCDE